MKKLPLYILLLIFPTLPVQAQFKDFLKKVAPKPQEGQQKPQQNKTEQLIFGGLKTLQAMMPIGYREELAIGGAVALEAVARFGGVVENPPLEKYVATVGSAVALTSDRPEIPYYFGILNTDEPNAFAAPGGYVFISKGLLKMLKSESELAGALGHEVAHVSKKHALDAIRRSKMLSGVSEVTLSALDKDPAMFDSLIKESVNLILERGLGREKEIEADRVGTDFAFRVGYNPAGLKSCLMSLKAVTAGGKRGLFKTHPDPGDRAIQLTKVLSSPIYSGADSLPVVADRFSSSLTASKL
ncbi:MAG TPA: M48 family metalloprotease [Bdellovibrionota bacterium]|nr:M48 family metalloprotease [Bdellovibrionota bacterium]